MQRTAPCCIRHQDCCRIPKPVLPAAPALFLGLDRPAASLQGTNPKSSESAPLLPAICLFTCPNIHGSTRKTSTHTRSVELAANVAAQKDDHDNLTQTRPCHKISVSPPTPLVQSSVLLPFPQQPSCPVCCAPLPGQMQQPPRARLQTPGRQSCANGHSSRTGAYLKFPVRSLQHQPCRVPKPILAAVAAAAPFLGRTRPASWSALAAASSESVPLLAQHGLTSASSKLCPRTPKDTASCATMIQPRTRVTTKLL